MPIIVLLLLAALVATYGFWDTLQAVLGAIGVVIVLCLLFVGLIAGTMAWLIKR
jgi:hypothetical protein